MRSRIPTVAPIYAIHLVIAALLFNLAGAMPPSRALAANNSGPIRIVALGDSLTAGYALPPQAAFPAQLAKALKARGHDVDIQNAGVSGDTTAAGLERLDWSLAEDTEAVILELGANDALRGLSPAEAQTNLDKILTRLNERGIAVLLAGMVAPRSLGAEYVAAFDGAYASLAAKHGVLLYPFFLDGVTGNPALSLDDGLHPNQKGVALVVERIMPKVEELIEAVKKKRNTAHASP